MKKVALVFISLTGNTEAMADVLAGALKDKVDLDVYDIQATPFTDSSAYDALVFGCPAMGDEVLEEDSFEPMFNSIEASLAGKDVALFGSYGWGDGQWMRDWQDRVEAAGGRLVGDPVIAQGAPDDEATTQLEALAAAIAS